jgi:cyclic dehypoxanthinyl futalosine synthase
MIAKLLEKSVAGERLTPEEGLELTECNDLALLGSAANAVTRRLHPESYRTYNIDRNINYTNVCTAVCNFCAFYRSPKDPEGYVLKFCFRAVCIPSTNWIGTKRCCPTSNLNFHN